MVFAHVETHVDFTVALVVKTQLTHIALNELVIQTPANAASNTLV